MTTAIHASLILIAVLVGINIAVFSWIGGIVLAGHFSVATALPDIAIDHITYQVSDQLSALIALRVQGDVPAVNSTCTVTYPSGKQREQQYTLSIHHEALNHICVFPLRGTGTYALQVNVDPHNMVYESHENNNELMVSFTV